MTRWLGDGAPQTPSQLHGGLCCLCCSKPLEATVDVGRDSPGGPQWALGVEMWAWNGQRNEEWAVSVW